MSLKLADAQKTSTDLPNTVHVTAAAASAIDLYLKEHPLPEGKASGLRIGVRGGGCSGLSYFLEPEVQEKTGDLIIDVTPELKVHEDAQGLRVHEDAQGVTKAVRVFIDPKSLIYLRGSTLDYVTGLMESGFKFVNPNAGKGCGCGESFAPR